MALKILGVICGTIFFGTWVVVANPACVENDAALAAQVYDACLKNSWSQAQCRKTAGEVTCKRWDYWRVGK